MIWLSSFQVPWVTKKHVWDCHHFCTCEWNVVCVLRIHKAFAHVLYLKGQFVVYLYAISPGPVWLRIWLCLIKQHTVKPYTHWKAYSTITSTVINILHCGMSCQHDRESYRNQLKQSIKLIQLGQMRGMGEISAAYLLAFAWVQFHVRCQKRFGFFFFSFSTAVGHQIKWMFVWKVVTSLLYRTTQQMNWSICYGWPQIWNKG